MSVCVYAYMSDTSIRVSTEAKRRLDLYKREGDSYEDVIMRLTERDKWAGFGAISDPDTQAGMEKIRREMGDTMTEDIRGDT